MEGSPAASGPFIQVIEVSWILSLSTYPKSARLVD